MSEVLSFRHTNQTSKNVAFTTFKNEWLEKNMFGDNYEKLS